MGYGFAYYITYLMFNYITWYFNPAIVLGAWVLGQVSVGEFFAIVGAELAGALAGVCFCGWCACVGVDVLAWMCRSGCGGVIVCVHHVIQGRTQQSP